MKFKNIEHTEDGKLTFDVEANKEEVAFLVDHAVNSLLADGIISLRGAMGGQEVTLRGVTH